MPKVLLSPCLMLLALGCAAPSQAQNTTVQVGSIEFFARVTPTGARPEPVRQFTFYLLTKSYADILRDAEAADALPTREQFIDGLKVSPQLKAWMKSHDTIDLASPEIEQMLSPDDIVDIPEFRDAYLTANSGGVAHNLPQPKFSDADRTTNPQKYERRRQEYFTALKKFVQLNPQTLTTIEAYLDSVSPARRWNQISVAHRNRLLHRAPEIAQTRYLAGKADTDLDGRGALYNVPAGTYWISTLDLDAAAGDVRLRWDVQLTVQARQTTQLELTNLNGTEKPQTAP